MNENDCLAITSNVLPIAESICKLMKGREIDPHILVSVRMDSAGYINMIIQGDDKSFHISRANYEDSYEVATFDGGYQE